MNSLDLQKPGAASLVFLCAFLLFAERGPAQSPTPRERLHAELSVEVHAKSGEPLRGVTVHVTTEAGSHERSTNAAGVARFRDLPSGAARVQAILEGWNPSGRRLTLPAGERTDLRLTLEPHAAPEGTASPEPSLVPSPSDSTDGG